MEAQHMFDFGFGILCVLPMVLLGVLGTIFWVWMLVECLTKESSEGNDKLIWALVIVLTNVVGAAIYYVARRPTRIKELGR